MLATSHSRPFLPALPTPKSSPTPLPPPSLPSRPHPPLALLASPSAPFAPPSLPPTSKSLRRPPPCPSAAGEDVDGFPLDGLPVGEYGERIMAPSYEEGDGVGEIKLECDESGCVLVMPRFKTLAEEDDGGRHLRCDLSGCYWTEEPPASKTFEVIEGVGWRLGYETAPDTEDSFCAIVGAGGWSIALTASEFNDFCQLIQTLRKGISTMEEDGVVGKDDVVMQAEKGSVWMECSIPKKRVAILQNLWKLGSRGLLDSQQLSAFELRFILSGASGRRQAEGFWPAEAVMDMLKKVDVAMLEQGRMAKSSRSAAQRAAFAAG